MCLCIDDILGSVASPVPYEEQTADNSSMVYEDEGLDLSQRLNESLFAGPELDADSEEIIFGEWVLISPHYSRDLSRM